MQVVCIYLSQLNSNIKLLESVAEVALLFSPQIAVSDEAVFLEIDGSKKLFSSSECLLRLRQWLFANNYEYKIAIGPDIATALAFAKYSTQNKNALPIEALECYLSPFKKLTFASCHHLRELGIKQISQFLEIPVKELATRFGKDTVYARDRIASASRLPWPRYVFSEKIQERVYFECASQIENLEPVLFLVKQILDKIFIKLFNRQEKLLSFELVFHFNPLSRDRKPDRSEFFQLPIPQLETKPVYEIIRERLHCHLAKNPLSDAVESISILVKEKTPNLHSTKNFFTKEEDEQEKIGAIIGRIRERLGEAAAIQAMPVPRLLPEASWAPVSKKPSVALQIPLRPLRFLHPAIPIIRKGISLVAKGERWQIKGFSQPERLEGEWWLGGFYREYYRVETEKSELWIYKSLEKNQLFLHGVFE